MKSLDSGSGVRWRHRRNYIWGYARLRIILAPSSGRGRRVKRGGVGIPACENTASRANLRPFGAPPSKGRREHTHYPPHKSLPRVGKVASKARRIGCWQYDNERKSVSSRRCGRLATQEYSFPQRRYKKTQPMRAALSDFKNYTLKRK